MLCVPVLFVSPLVTIFVHGYDTQVYLSVLYCFVALVLVGTRHIASLWATWFLKIETIDDKALKEWYLERTGNVALEKLSEPAILIRARQDLLHKVTKAVPGLFKFRTTNDAMVLKLAKCFEATSVMMVGTRGTTWCGRKLTHTRIGIVPLQDYQSRFHLVRLGMCNRKLL